MGSLDVPMEILDVLDVNDLWARCPCRFGGMHRSCRCPYVCQVVVELDNWRTVVLVLVWRGLTARFRVRMSFGSAMHHCLTIPCVHPICIEICESRTHLISSLEGIDVYMGLHTFCDDGCVDSNYFMAVIVIEGLVAHGLCWGPDEPACCPTEGIATNLTGFAIFVDKYCDGYNVVETSLLSWIFVLSTKNRPIESYKG